MPTQAGTPIERKIWRISAFPEFLVDNGKTKKGEEQVIQEFLTRGIAALPTLTLSKEEGSEIDPGDHPLRHDYNSLLAKYGIKASDYAEYLYEAYWGIRSGDRIVLTFKDRIIAKGYATSGCIQNKRNNPTNPEIRHKIYFTAKWDTPSDSYGMMKSGPTSFKDITNNEVELKKCQELETKNMTRPYVEATNLILCGPPGTGKTFRTKRTACEICLPPEVLAAALEKAKKSEAEKVYSEKFAELTRGDEPQVEFITFHPNYDYSDFIEGYRPSEDGKEGFVRQDGVLMRMAKRALNNSGKNYLLVIDEINRGNIAKIFGETITLLEDDKRIGADFELQSVLPTSRSKFGLPSNLYIRGTMNTADRSIAMLDIALRRRFEFEEVPPNPDLLKNAVIELTEGTIEQDKLMRNLNDLLLKKEILGNRDYQIGHAWFAMPKKGDKKEDAKALADRLVSRFRKKIIPLLQEWMYETPEKLWGTTDDDGKSVFGRILKQDDPDSITAENIFKLQAHLIEALKKTK